MNAHISYPHLESDHAATVRRRSKVPEVVFGFWLVKICATTLGETGGDALSMTLRLGYAVSSLIFLAFFAVALTAQIKATRYHPAIYWTVVVATTTVGTTSSDFIDRTLGVGYVVSSIVLAIGVAMMLVLWRLTAGRIEYENIRTRRDELFYWVTILIANTLGTALGDYVADDVGLGFVRGALLFTLVLVVIGALYFLTEVSKAWLFWAAYVLTRPLGATVGDTLTKPHSDGGLALSRITSSLVIALLMIVIVAINDREP